MFYFRCIHCYHLITDVDYEHVLLQGDYIWIEPVSGREFDVAIGARVISAEGRRIQVKDDDGKVTQLFTGVKYPVKFSKHKLNKINHEEHLEFNIID